jgi:lipoyl(octanoyl) transferase
MGQDDTPVWHLWNDQQPRPGWANMAIDTALLDRAEQQGERWLRLYRWDPHCLSFGRHEPATTLYDTRRIRALGLDTVRRPTGGRAVWHAHELTYAVACPSTPFGSCGDTYLEIHRLLAAALEDLGVKATLAPRTRPAPLDAGGCFTSPVGGEVLVDGRKVVGSAQLRQGSALLQHGSILLQDQQSLLSSLQRTDRVGQTASRPATAVLPLVNRSGIPAAAAALASAVARSARQRWPGVWEQVTDPGYILGAAARHSLQFQSSSWTWAR